MAKVTASRTQPAFTDLCTSSQNQKAKGDNDSHDGRQDTFRFMDLPSELRNLIYSFALYPETKKTRFGGYLDEPQITAGLSGSTAARALSQVCRAIRQESMKAFYSKSTFIVRGVPDPFGSLSPMRGNHYPTPSPPAPGRPARPDPLDLWARTWGVLGAEHLSSLRMQPLSSFGALVQISMTDVDNPVLLEAGSTSKLSASALNAVGLKAFGASVEGKTASRKLERFLHEIGIALRKELESHRRNVTYPYATLT